MDTIIKKQLEKELKTFTGKHFESPSECRNPEQIRFYIRELCDKIETLRRKFNYVPDSAYRLLAAYNARQNSLITYEFRKTYH
jgi:hypothetical protein